MSLMKVIRRREGLRDVTKATQLARGWVLGLLTWVLNFFHYATLALPLLHQRRQPFPYAVSQVTCEKAQGYMPDRREGTKES